jgi:hypothetical protein
MTEDAEATARHDIDRVRRFAPAEERRAARQHQRRQLVLDRRHTASVEIGEQRRALQRKAQSQTGRILAGLDETHPGLIPRSGP